MDNTVEVQVQELGKVMITNRGEYISSKSYEILDIVSYNGSSFMSKIDDNTSVPAEEISPDELLINENWQLVAKKGDTYKVTEEDLQAIAKQITDNANSAFNQNVEAKTKEFNTNVTNKINDYDTNTKSTTETFDANAKKKLDEYNANDTKKLKAYNDNADSKLGAYNTNDTNKLKAYNTNADSKIEEYNTNANSKIAEYDEHSEELRNMAVSTDNELERVKSDILDTGSASDTFIHVEDSCMAKLKELEVEGVCEQKTTKGYNIFNGTNYSFEKNGVTISINKNRITLNGTANSSYNNSWNEFVNPIPIELGEQYCYSCTKVSGSMAGTRLAINLRGGATTADKSRQFNFVALELIKGSNSTANCRTDCQYVTALQFLFSGNEVFNNYTFDIQLEKGTTVSEYEPYTNEAPSPNPDYPQEIKTIIGSFKVTSCGKNLFDKSKILDKTYIDTTSLKVSSLNTTKCFYQKIKPNTTYTISKIVSQRFTVMTSTEKPKIGTVGTSIRTNSNASNITITSNENDNYIICFYYKSDIETIPEEDIISSIQLIEGMPTTSFESYIESLVEVNLPKGEFIGKLNDTYKDTLTIEYVAEDSKCHLKLNKKVGFKNFNDVSSILYSELQGDYFLFQIIIGYLPSAVMISNNFINKTNYGLNYNYESVYRGASGNKAFQFKVKKERVASYDAAGALSFIKNSNTDVYYALNTPYMLDLGPIDMPLAYKEVTNIFTNSDLLPKINAKYYRTFETTVQNMQINEKTLKQEITDLNSSIANIIKRLEVLESNNASTVEESEASNDLQN